VLFAKFLKLSRKFTYLLLYYLNTTVILIIVKGVASYDKILRDVGAMHLNTARGDEVGILRNYRGSLLVHSIFPIAVDNFERVGNDSD
jgi:hypothetical protein